MLVDVLTSGVSFREATQTIGDINAVAVLIIIQTIIAFPSTVSVDLSHTAAAAAAEKGIDGGVRTAGSDEHNYYCNHSSSADGRCYTRNVVCWCLRAAEW